MTNEQILYEWIQKMNKGHEIAFFAVAMDQNRNLSIYTTLNNQDELKDRLKHILFLLNNSREIINL